MAFLIRFSTHIKSLTGFDKQNQQQNMKKTTTTFIKINREESKIAEVYLKKGRKQEIFGVFCIFSENIIL